MRFSTAIVAIAAGAVSAYEYNAEYPAPDTTVYSTEVTSTVYPVTSTEAPYPVTSTEAAYPGSSSAVVVPYPNKYSNSSSVAVPTYPTYPPKGYPVESATGKYPVESAKYPEYPIKSTGTAAPYPPVYMTSSAAPYPACPTYSVKTVVEDVTTVIKTTKYQTVEVPCATATPSGYPVPSSNGTGTYAAPPPTYTAGASTMGASVILAAAAGLAALLL